MRRFHRSPTILRSATGWSGPRRSSACQVRPVLGGSTAGASSRRFRITAWAIWMPACIDAGDTSSSVVGGRGWTSAVAGSWILSRGRFRKRAVRNSKSGSSCGSFSQVSSHQSGRIVLWVKARSKPARSRRSTSEWNDRVASELAVMKADLAGDDRVECGGAALVQVLE